MTDEQIIIDGIDVSECDHFKEGYCHPGTGVCYKCDTNCQYAAFHFKAQLARKTQECEQKDKELLSNKKIINKLIKEIDELKVELKRYKQELKDMTLRKIEYHKESLNYQIECKELKAYAQRQENQREEYYKEYLKKVKALEEIEAVCLEDTYTFADGTQVRYDSLDDILDIISKAKGEDNDLYT